MNWQHFLVRIEHTYYTEVLMTALRVVVLIVSLRGKRQGYTRYLSILTLVSLLQEIVVVYDELKSNNTLLGKNVSQNTFYPYLIAELTCCLLYIKKSLLSIRVRKIIPVFILLFNLYTLIEWLGHPSSPDFYLSTSTIEGILIIIACLYFFYEIFTQRDIKPLLTEHFFWAISGMLIAFSIITPAFILINYVTAKSSFLFRSIYIINNAAYSLLFISFIIAIYYDKKLKCKNR